jgi:hypothetical protein
MTSLTSPRDRPGYSRWRGVSEEAASSETGEERASGGTGRWSTGDHRRGNILNRSGS